MKWNGMNINRKGQWKTKNVIEARRPDIVVVEKENNKAIIVDVASTWDHREHGKEGEKTDTTNSNNNNDYAWKERWIVQLSLYLKRVPCEN